MSAVLLDPRTGRAVDQERHFRSYLGMDEGNEWLARAVADGRLPGSVADHLRKARQAPRASGPTATKQGFNEVLAVDVADGTQISATTTETIVTTDFTFAGPDPHNYQGATFRITGYADVSTVVTTPGTLTLRLRWGGVGGTVLVASGAFAPSTVATTSAFLEYTFLYTVRSIGASGSIFALGKMWLNNFDPTSATTLKNELNMVGMPPNGTTPAVVSSLDFTTAKALSVTAQFSVSTAGTQLTNHLRVLECLN